MAAAKPQVLGIGSECPSAPEEICEMLYLRLLDPPTERQFSAHLEACSSCRLIYRQTVTYVRVLRAAARILERHNPTNC
jgi:hypothetical protein